MLPLLKRLLFDREFELYKTIPLCVGLYLYVTAEYTSLTFLVFPYLLVTVCNIFLNVSKLEHTHQNWYYLYQFSILIVYSAYLVIYGKGWGFWVYYPIAVLRLFLHFLDAPWDHILRPKEPSEILLRTLISCSLIAVYPPPFDKVSEDPFKQIMFVTFVVGNIAFA